MTPLRGRRVALWAFMVHVLVFGSAAVICGHAASRQYWLWRLSHGELPARCEAANQLAKDGSEGVIQALTELLHQEAPCSPSLVVCINGAEETLHSYGCWTKVLSATALGEIGRPAMASAAVLEETVNQGHEPTAKAAAEALRRIRGE